jgi:hypothetical protein
VKAQQITSDSRPEFAKFMRQQGALWGKVSGADQARRRGGGEIPGIGVLHDPVIGEE